MNERKDRAQMEAWMYQAEDNGRNNAAADFNFARATALLPEKAASIASDAQGQILAAEQQTTAAKADAMVQANASGSAGASVDQSVAVHDNSMARVADAIEKNKRVAMMGLGQEYEDLFWQQDAAKKELRLTGQISNYDQGERGSGAMSTGDWLTGAAAGAGAWIKNR